MAWGQCNPPQLLLVHPAGHCDQQEPERVQGFRREEGNIITGSPAVHGRVRRSLADLCRSIFRTLRSEEATNWRHLATYTATTWNRIAPCPQLLECSGLNMNTYMNAINQWFTAKLTFQLLSIDGGLDVCRVILLSTEGHFLGTCPLA